MNLIDATDKWDNLKEDAKREPKIKHILPLIMRKNDKARANLAKAFLEDEAIKQASFERSKAYLLKIEEEDRTPFWMWCTLYFVLGMLFMITVDNISYSWKDIVAFWVTF